MAEEQKREKLVRSIRSRRRSYKMFVRGRCLDTASISAASTMLDRANVDCAAQSSTSQLVLFLFTISNLYLGSGNINRTMKVVLAE